VGEGVEESVVAQSVADRDGEGGSRPSLSASRHTGRSSSRIRTRPESLRISSSTDRVRGSVDTIERDGSRRGLGGFICLLVCVVRVSHAPKIGPLLCDPRTTLSYLSRGEMFDTMIDVVAVRATPFPSQEIVALPPRSTSCPSARDTYRYAESSSTFR